MLRQVKIFSMFVLLTTSNGARASDAGIPEDFDINGTAVDSNGYYVTNCSCVVYISNQGQTRTYQINASGSTCNESMNNAKIQCDNYINSGPTGSGYTSGCIDCRRIGH